jgi:hypothetical protein
LPAIVQGFGKQRMQALAQGWRHRARSTSCPEQTGRRSSTGWPLGAPVRSAWAARGASGGGWAHPVPGLSGAPAVTTSRAALLRAHPRSDTSSTLPAYKGHCFARCADHP